MPRCAFSVISVLITDILKIKCCFTPKEKVLIGQRIDQINAKEDNGKHFFFKCLKVLLQYDWLFICALLRFFKFFFDFICALLRFFKFNQILSRSNYSLSIGANSRKEILTKLFWSIGSLD